MNKKTKKGMNVTERFLTSCSLALDPIKSSENSESPEVDFELSWNKIILKCIFFSKKAVFRDTNYSLCRFSLGAVYS